MPQYKGATLFSSNFLLRMGELNRIRAAVYRKTISNAKGTAKIGI
jgi:hypothetical protein